MRSDERLPDESWHSPARRTSNRAHVVGAGPNGLAAAICLAEAGYAPTVVEAAPEVGGAARSGPLTLDGFIHDLGSAIHPLAASSPLFSRLPLEAYGLRWIRSPASLAHPVDDGTAVLLLGDLRDAAAHLGADGRGYRDFIEPFVAAWPTFVATALAPPAGAPRHLGMAMRLAWMLRTGAYRHINDRFGTPRVRALMAGIAAHGNVPLHHRASMAALVTLAGAAHAVGWPLPRGGAGQIARALSAHLIELGGIVRTQLRVDRLDDLAHADVTMLDCMPGHAARLLEDRLSTAHRRRLCRYRYGPGVFKIDWALAEPIPWRAPDCHHAATVHLGGTFDEIARSESSAWNGQHAEPPFVILAQPTLFDATRAPAGRHVAWAYCHVPHGSASDMTTAIEQQVERFAPGFREVVLARRSWSPSQLEALNANLVGGDIGGGALAGWQFPFRPYPALDPYALPVPGLYLCSSATPPGPGVHGLCGMFAVQSVMKRQRDIEKEKS